MEQDKKEKEYIDILVAPYCLPKLLLALHNQGVRGIWVTQVDDHLMIRLEKDHVERIVYHLNQCGETVELPKGCGK